MEDFSVFNLTIITEFGSTRYLFGTMKLAEDQLFDYVSAHWDEAYPDDPIPEDEMKAIDMYFQGMNESFLISEECVLTEVEAV